MPLNKSKLWVLAMNSARARILRDLAGDGGQTELVLRSEAHKLRDIMADKPGRSFSSMGGGRRSAMEYGSDPLAEDEREFIRQVIAVLQSHRRAGDFDALAVFAEHEVLGRLRQLMPSILKDMVIKEVPKNLLHLSPHELPQAIARDIDNVHPVR